MLSRLTLVPYLPDHTDSSRTTQPSVVAIDELFQAGQVSGDTKPTSYHQNALVIVHINAFTMRSTKYHHRIPQVAVCSMIQKLSCETPPGFDEELNIILLPGFPRDYHEGMSL